MWIIRLELFFVSPLWCVESEVASRFFKKLWTPVILTDRWDDYNCRVTARVPLQHKFKCDCREGVVRATRIHSRIPA